MPDQEELTSDPPTSYSTFKAKGDKTYTVQEALDHAGFGLGTWIVNGGALGVMACEGVEGVVLALILPLLKCEWDLTILQTLAIPAGALAGQSVGNFSSSRAMDLYGRWLIMLIGQIGVAFFGIASAFSQNLWQMVILRFILGFFLEFSTTAAPVYTIEQCPIKERGFVSAVVTSAWGVGSLLITIIAYFILSPWGWRWLLIIAAIPCLVFTLVLLCHSDTPYYYVSIDEFEKANEALETICKYNGVEMIEGRLVRHKGIEEASTFDYKEWFSKDNNIKEYCLLFIMNLSIFWIFFGLIYTSPSMLSAQYCHGGSANSTRLCQYSQQALYELSLTTVGELFSVMLLWAIAEQIGRIWTIRLFSGIGLLFSGFVLYCFARWVFVVGIMVLRAISVGMFFVLLMLFLEIYPTQIRGTVLGFSWGLGRVVGLVSIGVGQYLVAVNVAYYVLTIILAYLVSLISACFFQRETLGVELI